MLVFNNNNIEFLFFRCKMKFLKKILNQNSHQISLMFKKNL